MSTVRFDVLGPLNVRIDDNLVHLTGRKTRIIASSLGLNPEISISLAALLRGAWEEPAPRSAVHQVRKIISSLRLSLPDDWDLISTSHEGYMLRVTAASSDLALFLRTYDKLLSDSLSTDADLAAAYGALALWRGRPCEGSEPRGSEARIRDLLQRHRTLLDCTVAAYTERGREHELVGILQVASRIHNDESGFRLIPKPLSPLSATAETPPTTPSPGKTGVMGLGSVPATARASASLALAEPWDLAAETPSRCLPRDLRDFSGREAEISELEALLDSARPDHCVVSVNGMGGVGKTCLAVRVAHRVAAHFSGGQLHVEIGGSNPENTLTTSDSLGILLRQLGVPDDRIAATEEGRTAQWRAATADGEVLVLLDDAIDEAQVAPLLPTSPRSAALVTSRVVLAGLDGASHHLLGVPSTEDCLQMLRSVAGCTVVDEDRASAIALVRCFGNLPLALRLAAVRLTTREFATIGELNASLLASGCPASEIDVNHRSVLGRIESSLYSMEDYDLDRYLRITMLPAPELDDTAVAAATGLSIDQARRTCRRLADRALLQRVAAGVYRIHPMLAQVADRHRPLRLDRAAQRDVAVRALRYYASSSGLVGTDRLSPSAGPSGHLLAATLNRCTSLSTEFNTGWLFAELCLAWERSITLHLDTDHQYRTWTLAQQAAADHSDASVRGHVQLALARCLWHRDERDGGVAAARAALIAAEESEDEVLQVRALLRGSAFCWLVQELDEGLGLLDRAAVLLEHCRHRMGEATYRRELAELTSNSAALNLAAGRVDDAARLSCEVISTVDIDPRVTITAGVTLAGCLTELKHLDDALDVCDSALRTATQVNSAYGRALVLQQRARILLLLPRRREALLTARTGLTAAVEVGSRRLQSELAALVAELEPALYEDAALLSTEAIQS